MWRGEGKLFISPLPLPTPTLFTYSITYYYIMTYGCSIDDSLCFVSKE